LLSPLAKRAASVAMALGALGLLVPTTRMVASLAPFEAVTVNRFMEDPYLG
jgi:hypothetical protein